MPEKTEEQKQFEIEKVYEERRLAIEKVLGILPENFSEIESGTRWYLSSTDYAQTRFHVLSLLSDGIQVDQTNIDDKYKPAIRVNFQHDEIPGLIHILLSLYSDQLEQSFNSKDEPF